MLISTIRGKFNLCNTQSRATLRVCKNIRWIELIDETLKFLNAYTKNIKIVLVKRDVTLTLHKSTTLSCKTQFGKYTFSLL